MSATRPSPAIPLSPSSPPESGLKERSKRRRSEDTPQSPATPPLMSVATKSYVSSYGGVPSSAEQMASQKSPRSPISSSVFTQQSTQHMNNSFSTPASSMTAAPRDASMEDLDQHRDKRPRIDTTEVDGQDPSEDDRSIMPTNHNRQPDIADSDPPVIGGEAELQEKPPATGVHHSKLDIKSLEELQKDMGEAFLLCKSTPPRSHPDPKTHLLSYCGLGPLLRTVARSDPLTGIKINKLRRSYEGQIKSFGLAGRNKSVKMDKGPNGKTPLWSLVEDIPEDEWQSRSAKNPIKVTPEFTAKVQKAMQMQPGTVRNNEHWEDVLGHERPRVAGTPDVLAKKAPASAAPARQGPGPVRPQFQGAAEGDRPRRTGKKRSYNDNSFEGYGDGYFDDDLDMDHGAYSDDDDGASSGRKKRKKEHSFSTSPTGHGGGYIGNR